MMNMLIMVRVHYTIDIVAGLLFSIFIYGIISRWIGWCDLLGNLPYIIVVKPVIKLIKLFENKRKNK